MSLPVNATLQAAQSYVRNVRAAQEFLAQQDATTEASRFTRLLADLRQAQDLLRRNPAAGRPARFLAANSAQAQALASRAQTLALAHGVPHLRELVVKPYLLLYAHSADRIVLLALKHERQLVFEMP
ncbi:MAG: type II toxin-antitoxin system RelE/ParE family toxin [Rubrivivax sp.]